VTGAPLAALSATLDRNDPLPNDSTEVSPLGHWLYFLPIARQSEIGPGGHSKRGGFLPPVLLPRRMWAGSRSTFHRKLRVGDDVTRVSSIKDVNVKHGRSGALMFVTGRHELSAANGVVTTEEHDIVYRDNPQPGAKLPAPQVAPTEPSFSREILPDPVLLFRYSALTLNGHRIHYDRRYVTEVEGYPGLVVHGPLVATLLLDLLRREMLDARCWTRVSQRLRSVPSNCCSTLHGSPSSVGSRPMARPSNCGPETPMDGSQWRPPPQRPEKIPS
jgi:3-methylfumaryl-CoA hydratase